MNEEINAKAPLVLKEGVTGKLVECIQKKLGFSKDRIDGIFGPNTKNGVVKFQKNNGLNPDGIIGPLTWEKLGFYPEEFYADSDVPSAATWIENYHLPEGEYVKEETAKKYIFIHHTAGRYNPYATVDNWASDDRGRVGTNYIIGGLPLDIDLENLGNNIQYDGRILRCIKDKYWGYHLGPVHSDSIIDQSLSIELCSVGKLEKKNGKFYTWFDAEVHPSQVVELETPFRGSEYYHAYSYKQIESLKALLLYLSKRHDINLRIGLKEWLKEEGSGAFEYKSEADYGNIEGLLSHSNVRDDKSDVHPDPKLIEMIKSF